MKFSWRIITFILLVVLLVYLTSEAEARGRGGGGGRGGSRGGSRSGGGGGWGWGSRSRGSSSSSSSSRGTSYNRGSSTSYNRNSPTSWSSGGKTYNTFGSPNRWSYYGGHRFYYVGYYHGHPRYYHGSRGGYRGDGSDEDGGGGITAAGILVLLLALIGLGVGLYYVYICLRARPVRPRQHRDCEDGPLIGLDPDVNGNHEETPIEASAPDDDEADAKSKLLPDETDKGKVIPNECNGPLDEIPNGPVKEKEVVLLPIEEKPEPAKLITENEVAPVNHVAPLGFVAPISVSQSAPPADYNAPKKVEAAKQEKVEPEIQPPVIAPVPIFVSAPSVIGKKPVTDSDEEDGLLLQKCAPHDDSLEKEHCPTLVTKPHEEEDAQKPHPPATDTALPVANENVPEPEEIKPSEELKDLHSSPESAIVVAVTPDYGWKRADKTEDPTSEEGDKVSEDESEQPLMKEEEENLLPSRKVLDTPLVVELPKDDPVTDEEKYEGMAKEEDLPTEEVKGSPADPSEDIAIEEEKGAPADPSEDIAIEEEKGAPADASEDIAIEEEKGASADPSEDIDIEEEEGSSADPSEDIAIEEEKGAPADASEDIAIEGALVKEKAILPNETTPLNADIPDEVPRKVTTSDREAGEYPEVVYLETSKPYPNERNSDFGDLSESPIEANSEEVEESSPSPREVNDSAPELTVEEVSFLEPCVDENTVSISRVVEPCVEENIDIPKVVVTYVNTPTDVEEPESEYSKEPVASEVEFVEDGIGAPVEASKVSDIPTDLPLEADGPYYSDSMDEGPTLEVIKEEGSVDTETETTDTESSEPEVTQYTFECGSLVPSTAEILADEISCSSEPRVTKYSVISEIDVSEHESESLVEETEKMKIVPVINHENCTSEAEAELLDVSEEELQVIDNKKASVEAVVPEVAVSDGVEGDIESLEGDSESDEEETLCEVKKEAVTVPDGENDTASLPPSNETEIHSHEGTDSEGLETESEDEVEAQKEKESMPIASKKEPTFVASPIDNPVIVTPAAELDEKSSIKENAHNNCVDPVPQVTIVNVPNPSCPSLSNDSSPSSSDLSDNEVTSPLPNKSKIPRLVERHGS